MSYKISVESDQVLQIHHHGEVCLQVPLGHIKPESRERLAQLLDQQIKLFATEVRQRLLEELQG